jgi:hypothetical protein
LSDRDALDQLRTSIAWKVAAGLSLTDAGFHPTVLTLWRNNLRASEQATQDTVIACKCSPTAAR